MDKALGYRSELRRDSAGDPKYIKAAASHPTPDEAAGYGRVTNMPVGLQLR